MRRRDREVTDMTEIKHILEGPQEKMSALTQLMKTQTGKDFEFTPQLVSIVSVIEIRCDSFTAKHRPLPVNPIA